jgi:hypothetical protein
MSDVFIRVQLNSRMEVVQISIYSQEKKFLL